MVSPNIRELLLAYLVVFDHMLSILVAKKDGKRLLVYYVSHVLVGGKWRYLLVEKFAYTLLIASQKLRPYFESHHITMLVNQSL